MGGLSFFNICVAYDVCCWFVVVFRCLFVGLILLGCFDLGGLIWL